MLNQNGNLLYVLDPEGAVVRLIDSAALTHALVDWVWVAPLAGARVR